CAATSECGAALTCNSAASGFPNGFCTAACDTAACTTGACTGFSSGAFCAVTCTADSTCRQGYSCCTGLGNVCVPSAACGPAECKRTVVASALPAAQILLHEPHTTGDDVPFIVPPGTGSITITQQAKVANLDVVYQGHVIGNSAVPGTITKPDNSKAYDDNDSAFSPSASPDGGTDPSGIYGY